MSKALLIIDVQEGILPSKGAERPAVRQRFDEVRRRIFDLVSEARGQGAPIVFVQHAGAPGHRLETGTSGWEICGDVGRTAGDIVVSKTSCDSFYETDLQMVLSNQSVKHLVVAGLMTQYCVDTTCRRAVSLGFDVTLVADAHTTADTGTFTVEQIVDHHNGLLDGFDAGTAVITVKRANEAFAKA
ncbi:cysteine hydrolase family protein [Microvirga lotononidis]|uniref:Nicotinamidase-like amidase n=1 Tax=Microvirga lotononidis TaxID=864069 RepID=I4YSY7_9HYPH|nr:cysteine hydrolase family protein [Microvirga lotononidis]EIM27079.1 nicotinamidase-like amidase [Microvirga lotononidis]WQO28732.1 cysteine hydrolase family protein [Microvirga lotononidis]